MSIPCFGTLRETEVGVSLVSVLSSINNLNHGTQVSRGRILSINLTRYEELGDESGKKRSSKGVE